MEHVYATNGTHSEFPTLWPRSLTRRNSARNALPRQIACERSSNWRKTSYQHRATDWRTKAAGRTRLPRARSERRKWPNLYSAWWVHVVCCVCPGVMLTHNHSRHTLSLSLSIGTVHTIWAAANRFPWSAKALHDVVGAEMRVNFVSVCCGALRSLFIRQLNTHHVDCTKSQMYFIYILDCALKQNSAPCRRLAEQVFRLDRDRLANYTCISIWIYVMYSFVYLDILLCIDIT